MTDTVTLYRADDGWRWRYEASGRCLADSGQGYSRRIDAVKGACRVLGYYDLELANIAADLREVGGPRHSVTPPPSSSSSSSRRPDDRAHDPRARPHTRRHRHHPQPRPRPHRRRGRLREGGRSVSQSESLAAIRARVEAARNRPHDYIAHLARDVTFLLVKLEATQGRIADAWDEGFQRACDETLSGFAPNGPTDEQNPYRSAS